MKKRDVAVRVVIGALVVALGCLLFFRRSGFVVRDHFTTTQPNGLRVLFIGNSHTFVNDLPIAFAKLVHAKDPSRGLAISDVTLGGATLADHLTDGTAAKTIARGTWDFVVLQEQSSVPSYAPANFEASVRKLDALVRAAHAKTVIYELWPHEGEVATSDDVYERVARAVNAILVPVGPAWKRALDRDPALVLYQPDGVHPTAAGTYLAACVFVGTLLGEKTEGLPSIGMVTPELAIELQRATP